MFSTRYSVLLLGFTVSCLMAQAPPGSLVVQVAPTFEKYGLEVVTSRQAHFVTTLEKLIGKEALQQISPIVPYLLIINNRSGKTVSKTTVRYIRTGLNGKPVVGTTQLNTTPGAIRFDPGMTIIHTPETRLSQALLRIRNGAQSPGDQLHAWSRSCFEYIFSPLLFSRAIVSLDSVVFDDGGVVGPDVFGVIDESLAKADAQRTVIAQVTSESISDTELAKWLDGNARRELSFVDRPDGTQSHDHNVLHLSGFSRSMLGELERKGRSALRNFLVEYGQQLDSEKQLHKVED